MKIKSFSPVSATTATVLILGSMPGVTSLRLQQYYAHPRNLFWDFMALILGTNNDSSYTEKLEFLNKRGVAIWDVLQYCEREGSLDSSIKTDSEIPNDFKSFLQSHPEIQHIFFNGQKAEKAFKKHVSPNLSSQIHNKTTFITLPSTSPANTHMTKDEKLAIWNNHISEALS